MSISSEPDSAAGPAGLIPQQYRQAILLLDNFSEFAQDLSILDACSRIVSLPPKERFTSCWEAYLTGMFGVEEPENIEEEDVPEGLVELASSDEDQDKEVSQLVAMMDAIAEEVQKKALDSTIQGRENAAENVAFALFLEELRDAYQDMQDCVLQDWGQERREKYGSRQMALQSRLTLIIAGEDEDVLEEMYEDVLFSKYYNAKFDGRDFEVNPHELHHEEIVSEVIRRAAVFLYRERDISVSRGAEIADVTPSEFAGLLAENGIRVGYGPQDTEVFSEESSLSKPN